MTTHGLPTERSFGLSVGGACLAAAALLWWRGSPITSLALLTAGVLLVALGAVSPSSLRAPHRAWWRVAHVLGWVNARVLLTLFFVLVLTPVGVGMRLVGRNPLRGGRARTNWNPYPGRRNDPRHYDHLY